MAREEIPPGSGNWYDYEVEDYREGEHVKQRVIRYIGRSGKLGTTSLVRIIMNRVEARIVNKIQTYIDNNNIYQVELGHYEGIKWIPLKTKRVNIKEALK